MQPVAITSGRHPYQLAIHLASVLCGVALTVTDGLPRSASETMSGPVQVLWVVLLVVSGLTAIAGAFWRGGARTALRVELSGVVLLAGGSSMYAVALFAVAGMQAIAAGSFIAGIAAGSWWRSAQIVGDVRRLAAAEGDPHDGG